MTFPLFRWKPALQPLRVVLLCCAALSGHDLLRAQEGRFKVFPRTEIVPESAPLNTYVVLTDVSSTRLVAPRNARVDIDLAARKLKFSPADFKSTITVAFTAASLDLLADPDRTALRQQVWDEYPGAQIALEETCHAPGMEGCAFIFDQITPYQTKLTTRLAFLPMPEGLLEVKMTASPTNFSTQRHLFGRFLNYLRVNPATNSPPPVQLYAQP